MMSHFILVRGVRQLLTLHGYTGARRGAALGELGIIRDGALLIRDGLIHDIGPSRRIENLSIARQAAEVDAGGRVVMPGFVDPHVHLLVSLPWLEEFEARIHSVPLLADAMRGPEVTQHAINSSPLKRLEVQASRFLQKLAAHGTTTLECKSGWGCDESSEIKLLRLIRAVDQLPLDVVAGLLTKLDFEGRDDVGGEADLDAFHAEFLGRVRRLKLARFADVDGCPVPRISSLRRYYEAAGQLGMRTKLHAGPGCSSSALRLAVEFGAVSADHLESMGADDLDILARSSTIATLLPGPAFHSGARVYPAARHLIDAGGAVALGSNFHPGESPTYSMQTVVGLACARMRMSPAEAISAATINAAHAVDMADSVGSLEPGKKADLLICNAQDFREIPYYLGSNNVYMTIKRGVVVYRESAESLWDR